MTMNQQLDATGKQFVTADLFCGAAGAPKKRSSWFRRAKLIGFILLAAAAAIHLVLSARVTAQ